MAMTVLAFLQNQWVREPEKVQRIFGRHATNPDDRADLVARFLDAAKAEGGGSRRGATW